MTERIFTPKFVSEIEQTSPLQIEKALNKLCSRKNRKLGDVLDEAKELINGERQEDYGSPRTNMDKIAEFWSAYLCMQIRGEDVCAMMALLKMARMTTGHKKRDNPKDVAGYMSILADCYYEEGK